MEAISKNISRRNFIKFSSLTGAALTLGLYSQAAGKEAEIITPATAENLGIELKAWITIDTNGKVTITNHRSEMGQGSFQSVPQMIAEELEVNLSDINIVFAQGNNAKYGSQTEQIRPMAFYSHAQQPGALGNLDVRYSGAAGSVVFQSALPPRAR